jgi:hypothetical protein
VTSRSSGRLAIGIVSWTVATFAAFLAEAPGPVRVAVVVPFVLIVPGIGWAARFAPAEVTSMIAIGIGLSLAAAMIAGQTLALAGWWSPTAGLGVLAAIAVGGAGVQPGVPSSVTSWLARHGRRAPAARRSTQVATRPGSPGR